MAEPRAHSKSDFELRKKCGKKGGKEGVHGGRNCIPKTKKAADKWIMRTLRLIADEMRRSISPFQFEFQVEAIKLGSFNVSSRAA